MRQLRGPQVRTCAWWSKRSSIALTDFASSATLLCPVDLRDVDRGGHPDIPLVTSSPGGAGSTVRLFLVIQPVPIAYDHLDLKVGPELFDRRIVWVGVFHAHRDI